VGRQIPQKVKQDMLRCEKRLAKKKNRKGERRKKKNNRNKHI